MVMDEPVIADALELAVQDCGFSVNGKSNSADDTISYIESNPVDLILLDVGLGEGKASIALAHEINASFKIPIIFIIKSPTERYLAKVKEARPMGFIEFPFKPEEIRVNIMLSMTSHTMMTCPSDDVLKLPFADELIAYLRDEIMKHVHGGEMTITRLSAIANMSESLLRRFTKQITGLAPMMFVMDTKLLIAQDLIQKKRVTSLAELAGRVGFQNTQQLIVLYKKKYDEEPVINKG